MPQSDDITMAVKMGPKCFPEIADLAQGSRLHETDTFHALCDFIDARLDCADFRLTCILRALIAYGDLLDAKELDRAKRTVLNFRYWMDEPGEDSMCFWSENHQLLFATCEYLAGWFYPDETFTNNGMTGTQRMEHAHPRIVRWLEHRARYGYIEWHSNVYYEEDAAPLALLIDFAPDPELRTGAEVALDLLFLDMAMHSWRGLFCATSGRCYEAQKLHPLQADTLELSDLLAGTHRVQAPDYTRLSAHVHLSSYTVPAVLRTIAQDQSPVVVRDSMGLDLDEVHSEFPERTIETTGMFLWAMEAFTNPQAIRMAARIMHDWNLQGNRFLAGLQPFANRLLLALRVHRLVSWVLKPSTNGVAIQRANTYTYRTSGFMLSTAVNYHPGEFGDQHHIWQATLGDDAVVLATHPGTPMFDDNARNFSPSYWVGNGINPHAVQHENVTIAIYRSGGRRGYLERARVRFTHAWFPFSQFAESRLTPTVAFGSTGEAYVALVAARPVVVHPDNEHELVQYGRNTAWICELGTRDEWGSFDQFCSAITAATVDFTGRRLRYRVATPSEEPREYELRYRGAFRVNGADQRQSFDRLESPWASAPQKPEALRITAAGAQLRHNYVTGMREIRDQGVARA